MNEELMAIRASARAAADIFNPEHLRPNDDGDIVLASLEHDLIVATTGYSASRQGWEIRDPGTGETTLLAGTPFDPHVAMKICHLATGLPLPVRPGETVEEARECIRAWTEKEG